MTQQQQEETGTAIDRLVDHVRKALQSNPDAVVMIVRDEAHRELAQNAFEKQHKNAVAAKGTMLALTKRPDPTLDDIIDGLQRLAQVAIGARSAAHQLDGTPIGDAIAANGKKGKRGGEPKQVGEILAITWADDVPQPRPKIGDAVRLASGQATSIVAVWGYHPDLHVADLVGAFEITDTMDWRGFVYAHNGEWRLVNSMSEYTDAVATESEADAFSLDAAREQELHEQAAGTPYDAANERGAQGEEQHQPEDAFVDELHTGARAAVETDTGADDVLFPENAEGLSDETSSLELPTQDEITAEKKRTKERKLLRAKSEKAKDEKAKGGAKAAKKSGKKK